MAYIGQLFQTGIDMWLYQCL